MGDDDRSLALAFRLFESRSMNARSQRRRSTLSPVVKSCPGCWIEPLKTEISRLVRMCVPVSSALPSSTRSVQSVAPMKRTPSIRTMPGSRR